MLAPTAFGVDGTPVGMNSNRNGIIVSSSEAERFTLHQTLRTLMPEAVADTLMSHLLPAGWSDVARASDIDALRTDTAQQFDNVRTDTKQQFDNLRAETAQQFDNMRAITSAKFDNVDARFDALRTEIDALRTDTKERFDKIDARFEHLEARLEMRFEKIDRRFDDLASMKRYVITTGIAIVAMVCAAVSPLWFEML